MRSISRFLLALSVAQLFSPSAAHAVFNGTAATKDGVGYLALMNGACTAVVIKNRCVLTAAHCSGPQAFFPAANYVETGPHSKVVRSTSLGDGTGGPTDLMMLWMGKKKYKSQPFQDLGDATWSPANLALGSAAVNPIEGKVMGYGLTSDNFVTNFFTPASLREGNAIIFNTIDNAGQGSIHAVLPKAENPQPSCPGDSGGPVLDDGGMVMGISSIILAPAGGAGCNPNTIQMAYTAFRGGNQTWIQDKMDNFCVPIIHGDFQISPSGSGYVKRDGLFVSDSFCSIGPEKNDITVEAHPNANYAFEKWENGMYGCPCDGSTSPSCTIPVGWENSAAGTMPMMSEHAYCVARFKSNIVMPSPTPSQAPTPLPTSNPVWPSSTPAPTPMPSMPPMPSPPMP